MKKYKVYRVCNGVDYWWGTWEDPISLAKAMFNLGKQGLAEFIKIEEELDVQVQD